MTLEESLTLESSRLSNHFILGDINGPWRTREEQHWLCSKLGGARIRGSFHRCFRNDRTDWKIRCFPIFISLSLTSLTDPDMHWSCWSEIERSRDTPTFYILCCVSLKIVHCVCLCLCWPTRTNELSVHTISFRSNPFIRHVDHEDLHPPCRCWNCRCFRPRLSAGTYRDLKNWTSTCWTSLEPCHENDPGTGVHRLLLLLLDPLTHLDHTFLFDYISWLCDLTHLRVCASIYLGCQHSFECQS